MSTELYIQRVQAILRFKNLTIPSLPNNNSDPTIRAALELKNNNNIVITETDKNLGLAVLDRSLYEQLVNEHLSDDRTYTKLTANEVRWMLFNSHRSLNEILHDERSFSFRFRRAHKRAWEWLLSRVDQPVSIPKFRVIPKIHKKGQLKSRPITGATNWITTAPSIFVSAFLREEVEYHDHIIIKNSTHFVKIVEDTPVLASDILFSFDVVSLYTNMDWDSVCNTLASKISGLPSGITELIHWILRSSLILYRDAVYHQTCGMAMGTNAAPPIAQLYLYFGIDISTPIVTEKAEGRLIKYLRFLDDIFGIWRGSKQELINLFIAIQSLLPNIRFTMEDSLNEIAFLDVVVFKHTTSDGSLILKTRLHQKEMNKYLYLPSCSAHNRSIKKGFIKGELIRYIRNNSLEKDYLNFRSLLRTRLALRGYSYSFFDNIARTVSFADRSTHLSTTTKAEAKTILPFKIRSSPKQRLMNISGIIKDGVNYIQTRGDKPPLTPILSLKSGPPLSTFLCRSTNPLNFIFHPRHQRLEISIPNDESKPSERHSHFTSTAFHLVDHSTEGPVFSLSEPIGIFQRDF
jgi:hypothetical protein